MPAGPSSFRAARGASSPALPPAASAPGRLSATRTLTPAASSSASERSPREAMRASPSSTASTPANAETSSSHDQLPAHAPSSHLSGSNGLRATTSPPSCTAGCVLEGPGSLHFPSPSGSTSSNRSAAVRRTLCRGRRPRRPAPLGTRWRVARTNPGEVFDQITHGPRLAISFVGAAAIPQGGLRRPSADSGGIHRAEASRCHGR